MSVEGRIDGSTATAFGEAVRIAIEETDRAILVDMAELAYIGSAGLRVILLSAKSLHARKRELALCALPDTIGEVFAISGFDKALKIHGTQAEALGSVAG